MASYQLDWVDKIQSPKDVFNLIMRYKTSPRRNYCIQNKSYYNGENWEIMHLPDRKYWCDRTIVDDFGNPVLDENGRVKKVNAMITNPFVSNNRVPYGIFHDIVSQKVNTLLSEVPIINTKEKLKEQFIEQFGYSMKKAATEASLCGKSYTYEDNDGNFVVFDTENCIPFYDDENGILKAFIRFIIIKSEFTAREVTIAEVYTEEGLTRLKKEKGIISVIAELMPYKIERKQSIILNDVKNISLSKIPIIEFKNNDECKSDLTPSIRAKIDVIDLVQSGFINNIEDFSDVFWVLKRAENSGMNEDDFQEFMANVNKTKKIFVDDATPEQFNIPHEARSKAVEMLELQIIKESGVIDSEKLSATQLTTTAIKAATMKLEQRVSDFEWFANESCRMAINLYQEYNKMNFEFDINFVKLLLNNTTEIIDNMVKVQNDLSLETRLNILKNIGFINDVEEEKKRIEEERQSSWTFTPSDIGEE